MIRVMPMAAGSGENEPSLAVVFAFLGFNGRRRLAEVLAVARSGGELP